MSDSTHRTKAKTLLPPHDRDAERALLAATLNSPDCLPAVSELVDAADFYFDAHQKIYRVVEDCYRGGAVPDAAMLASLLRKDGQLDDVGGISYIADLIADGGTGANAEYHARTVRDLAVRRRTIHMVERVLADAHGKRPVGEMLAEMSESAGKMRERLGRTTEGPADFEFVNLSTLKARPVKWAVPGRIPRGAVTLIAGYGGSGKSTLVRSYIASVTTGRPAFGMAYEADPPGNVLMIAAEDDYEFVVLPHLLAEGADLKRVDQPFGIKVVKGKRTHIHMKPEHTEKLKDHISKLPIKPHTLVIDPIASFAGRAGINDSRATEVRSVLDPLTDLAHETGMAVLVIAHFNKGSSDGGQPASNRIAGSRAYTDAVRMTQLVSKHPTDPDASVFVSDKKNLPGVNTKAKSFRLESLLNHEIMKLRRHAQVAGLPDEDFAALAKDLRRVSFGEEEDLSANDITATPKADGGKKLDQCIEWMRGHYKEFAYPSAETELAAKGMFGKDTIFKARGMLKDEGLQYQKDGLNGWWWGMGPPVSWKRRPEHTDTAESSVPSKSSGSSGSSEPSFSLIELPEPPEQSELTELTEDLEEKSRSVHEHLAEEKAGPKRKAKQKTGRSPAKPKGGKA